MRLDRSHALAFVFGVIFPALLVVGHGCATTDRQKALVPAVEALRAAQDGVVAWSQATQEEIVKNATSAADGEAKLAAHRATRQKIVEGLTIAESALALALTDPSVSNIALALADVKEAYDAIQAIRSAGGLSGPPAAKSAGGAP